MTPSQALSKILTDYGRNILQNPRQVEALFKDLCYEPEYRRDMNLLILALKEKIPHTLASKNSPDFILEQQLIKKMQEAYGVSDALAQQTVEYWSIAIYQLPLKNKTTTNNQSHLFEQLKMNAHLGFSDSQYELAQYYEYGFNGIQGNINNALKYYQLAADQNHARAQTKLGTLYYQGIVVQQDLEKSIQYFQEAVKQHEPLAANNLATCYEQGIGIEQNDIEAVRLYTIAAKKGLGLAQYNLARCYEYGISVEQNNEQAFQYYLLAAQQNDIESQFNIAWYYFNGIGTSENINQALHWFKQAAENNHILAQYNLAQCYQYGKGINIDYTAAQKWYYCAAKQGDTDAKHALLTLQNQN